MVVGSTLGAGLTVVEAVGIWVCKRIIGVNVVDSSVGAEAWDGEAGTRALNLFCGGMEVVAILVPLLVVRRIGVVVSSSSPEAQNKRLVSCLNLVRPIITHGGVITLTKEIVSFSRFLSIVVPRKRRTTPLMYTLLHQVGTTPVHFRETILTSDI